MSVTPRTFAAILGGAALLIGLLATTAVAVSASHAGNLYGSGGYYCGTVLAPDTDGYRGEYLQSCTDALGARGLWGWGLVIVGVIVLAAALLVRTRPAQSTR